MKQEESDTFETALQKIRKAYGNDAIIDMAGKNRIQVEFVSTNCLSLDRVLGGGLPKGRIIEMFGLPSSGKSVLSTYLMAQIQKAGGRAVLIDAEYAFSPEFAEKIGVNTKELIVSQPTSGEEALDIVAKLVEQPFNGIIVVDSVASLVPKAELEGQIGDQSMALQARMLSQGLRMLTGPVAKSGAIVVFINQLRDKVGVFYGNKSVSPGGNALKFYSSVRLEIRKGKNITDGEDESGEVKGNWIKVIAAKNKVGVPFKECELELTYEQGLDKVGDLIDTAVKSGVIKRQGNTYYYGEEKLGVGREAAKKTLADPVNESIHNSIYQSLIK